MGPLPSTHGIYRTTNWLLLRKTFEAVAAPDAKTDIFYKPPPCLVRQFGIGYERSSHGNEIRPSFNKEFVSEDRVVYVVARCNRDIHYLFNTLGQMNKPSPGQQHLNSWDL